MRTDEDRSRQLRAAISVPNSARQREEDAKLNAFYMQLATQGSALDLARQTFVDREKHKPAPLPHTANFSKPQVIARWHDGAAIPDEDKPEFAGWLQQITARDKALGENKRRLRATMSAWLKLAGSEQDLDKRKAAAFGRWHLDSWEIADLPAEAPTGVDQPFEKQLTAAVKRYAAKMGNR